MTPLEQTTVKYKNVGLSYNGRVHVEVNSSTTADGYSVTETGIVLYNSNGTPALELLLENVGGDIKNGKIADTHYGANIADNGSGVFVHGYVKISDGTNEYVKYTYNLYSTIDDVTHAPASGISNPITIMPLVYKKAMHFTGLTSAFYRPVLYPIYAENTATVENSKTIPIYSNGSNLTDYSFEGQCNQASTPTPNSPVEVEVFGDKTVNLYNDSTTTDGYRIIWATGAPYEDANAATSDYISVQTNVTYIASSSSIYIIGYDITQTYLGAWNGSTFVKSAQTAIQSITVPAGCAYIKIIVLNKSILHTNFMLNSGSTVLPYEPYGKYKIPITSAGQTQNIILSEPLRKIGDYADTIDSDGVVTRRIKKLVLDGTEDWDIYSSGTTHFFYMGLSPLGLPSITYNIDPISNSFSTCKILRVSDNEQILRCYDGSTFNSVSDFTTWLATQYANGTPVTVYYVLATSTTEYLPPYNNLFDYKIAYSTYINANGKIEGNAYSVSTVINYFTADQIGKSITITAFAKTVLSTRVAIQTRINGVIKESNSVTQDNSGLLKITVTPTSTSDYFSLTYGSGSLNNIYSWVGLNEGTNYIPMPTIPTSSGYSNVEIGTNLAPSKVELNMGKMFVPNI